MAWVSRKMWTTHELKKLQQLRAAGMSQRAMAKALGRSQSSIDTMCHYLVRAGVVQRLTPLEKERIRQRSQVCK
jgi:hypothetical protein